MEDKDLQAKMKRNFIVGAVILIVSVTAFGIFASNKQLKS